MDVMVVVDAAHRICLLLVVDVISTLEIYLNPRKALGCPVQVWFFNLSAIFKFTQLAREFGRVNAG